MNKIHAIRDEEKQDKELLEFYKNWIQIRKNSKALQKGATKFINVNDENKTFEIVREYKSQKVKIYWSLSIERVDKSIFSIYSL